MLIGILPPNDAIWMWSDEINTRQWLPYGDPNGAVRGGISYLEGDVGIATVYWSIATKIYGELI